MRPSGEKPEDTRDRACQILAYVGAETLYPMA